jgi:hypothetical protein
MMQMTVQQWRNSADKPEVFKPFFQDEDIVCGLVCYDNDKEVFQIYMGQGYNGTYDIEAYRILTSAGILDFLLQIHSKNWITGQHLKDFLDCITCWVYRDHGGCFPQKFYKVMGGVNQNIDNT